MIVRLFLVLSSLLSLALLSVSADEPGVNKDLAANAALYYWQALNGLDQKIGPATQKLFDDWKEGPPPAALQKLIDNQRYRLDLLHRGAKLPRCEWGLPYDLDNPFEMAFGHVQQSRTLAWWACTRARAHFEAGRDQAGVDDILASLTLARHIGSDPLLISILYQYLLEQHTIETIAPYLTQLKPETLKGLATRLGSLPKAATLQAAIRLDAKIIHAMAARIFKPDTDMKRTDLLELLNYVKGSAGSTEAHNRIKDLMNPGSRQTIIAQLDHVPAIYESAAGLSDLPWNQAQTQLAELDKTMIQASRSNPLIGTFFLSHEGIGKNLHRQARNRATWALFKAALDIAQHGPEKVKDHPDPFGDGPLQYRKLDNGFELKSKLTTTDGTKNIQSTLIIGQRK